MDMSQEDIKPFRHLVEQIKGLDEGKFPLNIIQEASSLDLTLNNLKQLKSLMSKGMLTERILTYIGQGLDVNQIADLSKQFENGMTPEEAKFCAIRGMTYEQMDMIREAFSKGVTPEQMEQMTSPLFNTDQMKEIILGFLFYATKMNLSYDDIIRIEDSAEQMRQHRLELEFRNRYGLTIEQANQFLGTDFDVHRLIPIMDGIRDNAPLPQILLYANERFSNVQLAQIIQGLSHGLNEEQMKLIANPEMDDMQMAQIRFALEDGLPIEEVAKFANPEMSWEEMKEAREEHMEELEIGEPDSGDIGDE